jgi:hypothetical protein
LSLELFVCFLAKNTVSMFCAKSWILFYDERVWSAYNPSTPAFTVNSRHD